MEVRIVESPAGRIAAVQSEAPLVITPQDALDLMATLRYEHDATRVVLPKAALTEEFFDLKTGLACEVLQKYTNYGFKLAIVGDFSGTTSRALRDFIRESNRGNGVFFLPDEAAALAALAGAP